MTRISDFEISDLRFPILLLLLMPLTVSAAAPIQRPQGPIAAANCVTPDCHADIKRHRVVHGPVHVDACDACHTLTDPATHTFRLARGETELCTFCHQLNLPETGVIHQPLTEGQCLQCHNPHGGVSNAFLRGGSMREMCASCHQQVMEEKKHVHGPVAADQCQACHQSHTAPFPKLLTAQGSDLCFTCHAEMKTQLSRVLFPHKAVEQDCGACHDPHASNTPMQVKEDPAKLCMSCHQNIENKVAEATHQHSVVTQDKACLTCHTPHGGDMAWLVRSEPMKMCMTCHTEPIKIDETRKVAGIPEVLRPETIKHGPIRDGNCSGCHNVHGGNVSRLLASNYPESFYQPFSIDKYELCFSCHDQQLVERPQARGLTGFRNGDVNMHYLHVNKDDKGRNCRACHSTHASTNELHIAETVPFGQWAMPINFQKTETGGSCAPGCHRPFEYDRVQPVQY
jgi:predicted CXXCH cytochrome family protein